MTDERPRPRYGEYADVPPVPTPSPAPAPEPAPEPAAVPVVRRRTWDVVLSTVLLLWGVFDVVTGLAVFGNLGVALRAASEQQGIEGFSSVEYADQIGGWLNIARVALLVLAIVVTLLRLARNRIAFWVPLTAGAVAALLVVICVMVIFLADPGFAQYVVEQTAR
jgi:hypothetical protein